MKTTILLILSILILSCQSERVTFSDAHSERIEITERFKSLKANEASNSIIYFTSGFSDSLVVKNGKEIILNKKVETVDQLGFADAIVVEKNKSVEIKVVNYKRKKIAISKQIKNFKFIYIKKWQNKFEIEYSNKVKWFY